MVVFLDPPKPRGEFLKSSSVSLASVATMLQASASAKKVAEKFGTWLDAEKSREGNKFTGN